MWAQNEQHQKWNILKKKCLIPKIIVYQQSNLTLLKNPQQLSIGSGSWHPQTVFTYIECGQFGPHTKSFL
jgi:hypothetical protein